jgi:hypothetical protein
MARLLGRNRVRQCGVLVGSDEWPLATRDNAVSSEAVILAEGGDPRLRIERSGTSLQE